ncbi:tRNA (adenosine(37)-N6)-threonylcarbamoyltransferase complex dimerization subunit type 1 TsaB [Mycoplasmatota bacterium]|nr:tRNA (adenosine(37)-N6)-threonylcarbamoyltransferase complex dimerization subunit type 1 TsaB [Mycoplasmatota bacterium]
MKKLLIDTSTQVLMIILEEDDKVKDYILEVVIRDHSVKLMPSIETLLKRNQIDIQEIDQIIASEGPGSYTGVRIGVTVAKTLSYTLNIPLKKISSLEVISASYINQAKYIVPLIDARRGNVFSALYNVIDHKLNCIFEPQLYHFTDFIQQIIEVVKGDVIFVGYDNHKFKIEDPQFHFPFSLIEDFNPELVMTLDFERVANIHHLVPNYKRLTEAEMNLK